MQNDLKTCRRILIVGTSCSGKSTFARELSAALGHHLIDSDELAWQPRWQPTPKDEYQKILRENIAKEPWIFAGNIGALEDHLVEKANAIIWLDYPFWIIFGRGLRRTLSRIVLRKSCCNGNHETMRQAFFSKQSVLYWICKSHSKWQFAYENLKKLLHDRDVLFLRLKSPNETKSIY